MPMRCGPLAVCLALIAVASPCLAQNESKVVVSLSPLTAEQLSVYRAVLAGWVSQDTPSVNLADRTVPLGGTDPANEIGRSCGKGFDLEPVSPTMVHQFQVGDLAQLGSSKIALVGEKRGEKAVRDNDPWQSIQKGRSIDDSVRNGFAHGLFTLSEIQFDREHKHAIVSYGFVCGSLCGSDATVVLEKTADGWRERNRCSEWISRAAPASRSRIAEPA